MRVGIISIQHESNTFIRTPTDLAHFRRDTLVTGSDIRDHFGRTHHEVGGFLEGLDEAGLEAVPILAARALPAGAIGTETLAALLEMMWAGLDRAGRLDGLLVAPHGAAVCATQHDMDGHWLGLLRGRFGAQMPMICTLDPHANLSQGMVDACTATVAYRSNPHLDQRQRGLEAARLMARTLRSEMRPTQACALTPVAINITSQSTDEAPCRPMYELADDMLKRPGVLSNSIVLGFPYADVEEMGSAFIVVTDNDPAWAQACADELASYLLDHRSEFIEPLIEVEQAIDQALRADGSVCLLDMGDNVGGGSSADGTIVANAIHRRQEPVSFVCICDPESVQQVRDAGLGAQRALRIGGKYDDMHGPPLEAAFTVMSLHDGHFTESQARHGGRTEFDMGPTAIVRTVHGLTVQLTTNRTMPVSLGQITSCGLDPASFKILLAKGVHAPVAAYRQVCRTMIRVNTAGSTSADMSHFTFHYRRRPLFPFEQIVI